MIQVNNLSFTYNGATAPAVNGIDFAVESGEIFGFLGPSGAGKSTTQKILIGLLKEFEGSASIFGQPLQSWGKKIYERIGVSFELPNHYQKLTALENLALFGSLYQRETQDPLHLLDLVDLREDADVRVAQYSKGMQMRLSFVRGLLHSPELLFLDEPTSGMDPVNGRRVKDLILDHKRKGGTVFLTTHNMSDAEELCDRIAFIVDGKIAAVDTPRNLKLAHSKHSIVVEYADPTASIEATTATREFPLRDIGSNAEFLALIREHKVETIHTQEASMEDIFISVTGRSLR